MGFQRDDIKVTVRLSRHNSDRDDEHDALREELKARIQEILAEERYAEIDAEVL